MNKIVAAIDSSAAARPVLSMAVALGAVLGAEVDAIHVADDTEQTAGAMAESLGVAYTVLRGDPFDRIIERAAANDVVAIVVGARRRVRGSHLGHLARQIADALQKPVLVVPPEAEPCERLHTVVIAMEGTPAKARSLKAAIDLASALELELIVVHVDDEESIPSFSDQVAHETEAYADEFLARYLPGAPKARLEFRVGVPADEIIDLSESVTADLLAVGWPHTGDADRGAVAQEILDRSHVPVLLVAVT
jgi:nucleotide-binding universal stress UspA family protein